MSLRVFLKVSKTALIKDIEYRVNYLILILSLGITFVVEGSVFSSLYSTSDKVGGYTRGDLLSYLILGLTLRTLSQIWSFIFEMTEEIRNGKFRTYLLQPLHFPSYFFGSALGPKVPTLILLIFGLFIARGVGFVSALGEFDLVVSFTVSAILSIFLVWQIYLAIIYLTFWFEEVNFLMVAFNLGVGVFSGSFIPFEWLPVYVQNTLNFTPLPLVGEFPIKLGLGLLNSHELTQGFLFQLFWISIFGLINRFLFIRGTRRYEAFGG